MIIRLLEPIALVLWGIAIVLMLIVAGTYLRKGMQSEEKDIRFNLLGFSGLILGLAITRLLFILAHLSVEGVYIAMFFMVTLALKIQYTIILSG